jgi:hypothetical protein
MLDFLVLVKLLVVLPRGSALPTTTVTWLERFSDPVGPALGSRLDPLQGSALIHIRLFDHQVAFLDLGSFVLGLPVGDG